MLYTEEQLAAMAPQEREAALIQMGIMGPGGSGINPLGMVSAIAEAQARADKVATSQVATLTSGDVEYVEGLQPSDAHYPGEDHSALKQYVSTNLDSNQVGEVSRAYHELHTAFQDFAQQLKDAVSKSQHEWEGDAADQAHGYFSSLSTWADSNSQNAQLASEVMYQQSEAATTAKNSMPEEVPFDWDTEFKKWASNPLGMADNIDSTIETYQRSQEAHAEAARVMTQYDNDLFTAASKQPVFAEPPKFGAGGADGVRMPSAGTPIGIPGGDAGTSASGYTGGSIPGSGTGSVGGGSFSAPGGSGGSSGGGGYTPAPAPLPSGRNTGAGMPPNTRPSGYRPPTARPRVPSGGGSNTGFGGMGAMPVGGMAVGGMGGGGSDYSSKLGRGSVGGFGPGGSGAAGGPGAGPGAASGAARPGMGGMPGAAPGAAAAAGGAGRGAGGMGAMGAGAGRGGQGGDDAEHQRPTYLVEGDPDEVFGTDERTAPPVIGE